MVDALERWAAGQAAEHPCRPVPRRRGPDGRGGRADAAMHARRSRVRPNVRPSAPPTGPPMESQVTTKPLEAPAPSESGGNGSGGMKPDRATRPCTERTRRDQRPVLVRGRRHARSVRWPTPTRRCASRTPASGSTSRMPRPQDLDAARRLPRPAPADHRGHRRAQPARQGRIRGRHPAPGHVRCSCTPRSWNASRSTSCSASASCSRRTHRVGTRRRPRTSGASARSTSWHSGTDFMLYAIVDPMVDGYFPVLDTPRRDHRRRSRTRWCGTRTWTWSSGSSRPPRAARRCATR